MQCRHFALLPARAPAAMAAAGDAGSRASRAGGAEGLAEVPNLEALLSCSDSCFKVLDLDGRILYLSPSAKRVLRVEPAQLVGCDPRVAVAVMRHAGRCDHITGNYHLHTDAMVSRRSRRCVDIVHDDDRAKVWAVLHDVRAQRPPASPVHALFRLRDAVEPDGSVVTVEDTFCRDVRAPSRPLARAQAVREAEALWACAGGCAVHLRRRVRRGGR